MDRVGFEPTTSAAQHQQFSKAFLIITYDLKEHLRKRTVLFKSRRSIINQGNYGIKLSSL
jgi:hypothetical protein